MEEAWIDIPGYERLYQASNQGRIRTCEGKETSNARYSKRVWKQRIMKPKLQTNRYGRTDARVSLWKDGKSKDHLVARLVAMAWCDGYSPGMTVNHIDGNSMNNNAYNLEWVSLGDNIRKGFDDGLYHTQKSVSLVGDAGSFEFDSQAKASRFLGRCSGYVNGCIKSNKNAIAANGKVFQIMQA